MQVANLFLHNLRSGVCPGWTIADATDGQEQTIRAALSKHVEYDQDAGFNEWRIWRCIHDVSVDSWGMKRFTWDTAWYGTLVEVLARYNDYYQKRSQYG